MDIVIGIGEYAVSDKEEDVLKTFALGTCFQKTVKPRVIFVDAPLVLELFKDFKVK